MLRRSAVVAAGLVFVSCNGVLTPSAAVVDGSRISTTELDREYRAALTDPSAKSLVDEGGPTAQAALRTATLGSIVRLRLAAKFLSDSETEVTTDELDKELKALADEAGGEANFYGRFGGAGIGPSRAKELVFRAMVLDRFVDAVTAGVSVTEEEIVAAYEGAKSQFVEVRLFVATVSTQEKADALVVAREDGALFSTLARRRSTDDFASKGGDMGWTSAEAVDRTVASAIAALPDGAITVPIQLSADKWAVYEVNARRAAPLETVRERITQGLLEPKRAQAIAKKYGELFDSSDVRANPEFASLAQLRAEVIANPSIAAPESEAS